MNSGNRHILGYPATMTTSTARWVAVGFGGISAAAFVVGVATDNHGLRMLTKPWPVLLMAMVVFASGGQRYRLLIGAGLLASLAGDILLEVSENDLSRRRRRLPRRTCPLHHGLPRAIAAVACAVGPAFHRLGRRGHHSPASGSRGGGHGCSGDDLHGRDHGDVVARRGLLGDGRSRPTWTLYALAGALLFAVSDTLIAVDRFAEPFAGARYLIILLYWSGQIGITLSALRFQR